MATAWFLVWYMWVNGQGLVRDYIPVGNQQQCEGLADSLSKMLNDPDAPAGFAIVRCERDQPPFPQLNP